MNRPIMFDTHHCRHGVELDKPFSNTYLIGPIDPVDFKGWMTRQIFLAYQNQCVSKPT